MADLLEPSERGQIPPCMSPEEYAFWASDSTAGSPCRDCALRWRHIQERLGRCQPTAPLVGRRLAPLSIDPKVNRKRERERLAAKRRRDRAQ